MYVCVSCTGNLRAGDIIILEKDEYFGEVAAKKIGGGIVGFVTDRQPEGCVSRSFIESRIGANRVIGHAVILNGNVALFSSESSVLNNVPASCTYSRRGA
ncbi:MAG: hypothetical protein IKC48_02720 [Clostridia bacterium]|nr:hypothetical protein [Clostridia bacterium]